LTIDAAGLAGGIIGEWCTLFEDVVRRCEDLDGPGIVREGIAVLAGLGPVVTPRESG
jgi:hypothetical protein